MRIRVIDIETCGEAPPAPVVEIAAWDLVTNDSRIWPVCDMLVDPGAPIPPLMSAIHHIVDEDVAGALTWEKAWPHLIEPEVDVYCAHNAKFERLWLESKTEGKPWLCTYRCALRAWPGAPGHKNQELRYWLKPPNMSRGNAGNAHRASGDAYVTANVLRCLLDAHPVERLLEWSSKHGLLPNVTFGKHKGMAWKDVPLSYLQWLTRESDMNEDVIYTAKHWTSDYYRRHGGHQSASKPVEKAVAVVPAKGSLL